MGNMDQLKAMGVPFQDGAFGASKEPLLGKGALGVMLNAIQSQLAKGNEVADIDAVSLAAAGGSGLELRVVGTDWSETVGDWEVTAGGVACTVNSVDASSDPTSLDIDTPVLPVGAGVTVALVVKGTRAGGTEKEVVGSLSLPTV